MTCILSALFPCSCELNGRGPYYSEAGREPIRSTELSTGSSASVSVHGRVPQQFSPYGQLNWNLQQLHFKSSSIAWTLSFRLTATFPPNWEQSAWFQFPYNDLNCPTTSAFSTVVWISLFDKVEHLTFDFLIYSFQKLVANFDVTIWSYHTSSCRGQTIAQLKAYPKNWCFDAVWKRQTKPLISVDVTTLPRGTCVCVCVMRERSNEC